MGKECIYAKIEEVDFLEHSVVISRKVYRNGKQTNIWKGKVTKIGPGVFRSERFFGKRLTKEFTVKNKSVGFIISESTAFLEALHWSIQGYYMIVLSSSKASLAYKRIMVV